MIVGVECKHLLGLGVAFLLDDRLEQRFLAVEIDIERAFGDAGLPCDLAHTCAVEALRQEDLARPFHDLPPLGAILPLRGGCKVSARHFLPPVSAVLPRRCSAWDHKMVTEPFGH